MKLEACSCAAALKRPKTLAAASTDYISAQINSTFSKVVDKQVAMLLGN